MIYPDNRIIIGFAPTKRNDINFPMFKAIANKEPIVRKLNELGIEYVTLDDVCEEGILSSFDDVDAAEKKFREAGVNALFIPNVTYGAEGQSATLAKRMNLPVLLWGPSDPEGVGATGKPQLGIYTIGKIFRRMGVPFSFMGSCSVDHPLFEKGLRNFIAAANVVKEFRRARILQIGPRPESFWNVMIDEGSLLEKFGIYVYPMALPELYKEFWKIYEERTEDIDKLVAEFKERTVICTNETVLRKCAALTFTFEKLIKDTQTTAIAVQCWHVFPEELGIWPCAAGAMLTERGVPVVCEGDIYGAVTSIMASAASMGKARPVFVDLDTEHPDNVNAFNTHHCSIAPISCYAEKPRFFRRKNPADNDWGGAISGQWPPFGDVTIMRFDGDNNEFSVLLCKGKGVDGPAAIGKTSYGWYEVQSWPQLENKLVRGPYIHHGVVIYDDILPQMYEAIRYIKGLEADFVYDNERKEAEGYMYERS